MAQFARKVSRREACDSISYPLTPPKASGELPDSFEAALWTGNLDHRTRPQPEPAQASNGRQIERRVSPVERNVQKGFGSGSGPAQRAWLTRAGRCALS